MSERKYFCFCEANCRFETMTKEQILAAIAQAAESGLVVDPNAGFITKVKESNAGGFVTFWVGTMAQYNALDSHDPNCIYIKTDDNSGAAIAAALEKAVSKQGDTMEGALNMDGNQLTGLPEPLQESDAATKGYADGKTSMELLWENASTASTFAGQTLSREEIGGKKWAAVAIECGALSTLCFVGRGVELFGWKNFMNYDAYAQPVRRTFMLNEDGSFTIGKGYNKSYNGKPYNEDNSVVIPSRIFGIKEATE